VSISWWTVTAGWTGLCFEQYFIRQVIFVWGLIMYMELFSHNEKIMKHSSLSICWVLWRTCMSCILFTSIEDLQWRHAMTSSTDVRHIGGIFLMSWFRSCPSTNLHKYPYSVMAKSTLSLDQFQTTFTLMSALDKLLTTSMPVTSMSGLTQ
jgi:hypothetical protein